MTSKAKKGQQVNKTYQTQPLFKDKFQPAQARAAIKAMIDKKLLNMPGENEIQGLVKELAEDAKKEVRRIGDDRYKYLIQVIVG